MRLNKTLNIILAALLIVTATFIGGMTIARNVKELGYAVLVTYTQQLPESPDVFDNITARISSLKRAIDTNLYKKSTFEKLNAQLQLGIGKEMLSFGGSMMVTTNTGHLYDLVEDTNATRAIRKTTLSGLVELNERLRAQGIPLVYGYAHTTLYDGESLPKDVPDDNNAIADEIVQVLTDAGIPTIDSRQIMRETGLPLDEIIYRTDAHWSARSAFEMYARMVDLLNDETSIKADKTVADLNQFDINVLPGAHISDIGNRLGAGTVQPDDFELITPKFETNIHRDIMQDKQLASSDGAFEDVVLDKAMLPEAKGVSPTNCYNYYGQHPDVVYYHNESAPEGRLLIVKDSYGTPTSSFMALAVRDVCAIDLRKTQLTIEDYVKSFNPDVVMIVQCQEVMRGQNFVFIDQ
ncbi:hypothetical protein LJC33_09030 [Eubacteriales bacterium OttesenSCG-928-N13]|nr:hypothetical protein [Eubacteriales bacterium OttesenSCG-928-N13]